MGRLLIGNGTRRRASQHPAKAAFFPAALRQGKGPVGDLQPLATDQVPRIASLPVNQNARPCPTFALPFTGALFAVANQSKANSTPTSAGFAKISGSGAQA
jgi:hypothetical protein